ncbi:MAG TPA: hypothetical protein PLJ35_07600 [Anaerolineae bacterium]|nr:hypothetical protein [Anaerolineae bacterium]HOQ98672.1 hypothetical protein [Anaerolineae bacterium]HPL26667.1 hypothetical protein [Anaerolineae bacterium]
MTSLVNSVTTAMAQGSAYVTLSRQMAVVIVALLLLLLVARLLTEANGEAPLAERTKVFNLALWPLLVAFALFVAGRLWLIVRP